MNKAHAIEHRLDEQAKAASALMDALAESGMDGDEELALDMVEGETSLLEALDTAVVHMADCDIIAEGCKAVMDRISIRMRRAKSRKANIRTAIEQALAIADITEKIQRPAATFTLAKISPARLVDDEAAIPAAFFKQPPPVLDRAKLKDAPITDDIPGTHVDNGSIRLTIRTK